LAATTALVPGDLLVVETSNGGSNWSTGTTCDGKPAQHFGHQQLTPR
jgi:hypothetical protein